MSQRIIQSYSNTTRRYDRRRVPYAVVRFVNGRCQFRDTSKFFNYQRIFLYEIKEKRKFVSIHPVSNPKPLFPNIPLLPLHYQVDAPNLCKIKL